MFYDEFDDEEGIIAQDDALEQMLLDEEPIMASGNDDFKIDQGSASPATPMVPNPTTRPAAKALTNDDHEPLKPPIPQGMKPIPVKTGYEADLARYQSLIESNEKLLTKMREGIPGVVPPSKSISAASGMKYDPTTNTLVEIEKIHVYHRHDHYYRSGYTKSQDGLVSVTVTSPITTRAAILSLIHRRHKAKAGSSSTGASRLTLPRRKATTP
jgi:hypothetical protein